MTSGIPSHQWTAKNRRNETPAERADRNFVEQLQEFRVAQQIIGILFAFLLTIPFNNRFTELNQLQEWVYFGSLMAAATGTIFFVAPVSMHRILFRMGMKDAIVKRASVYAIIGLTMMWLSMASSVFLVASFVFNYWLAGIGATAGSLLILWIWFLEPLIQRHQINNEKSSKKAA